MKKLKWVQFPHAGTNCMLQKDGTYWGYIKEGEEYKLKKDKYEMRNPSKGRVKKDTQ